MIEKVKHTLRSELRRKSRMLSETYKKDAGAAIARQVIASEQFQKADVIFIYVSLPTEPDTAEIMKAAWNMQKKVCVPKCITRTEMKAFQISSPEELVPGPYGILEPVKDAAEIEKKAIDLAVIPCTAASADGKRMGHGAGYYDSFLAGQTIYKMCLCFEELLCNEIPTAPHDVKMDCVITER